VDRFTLGIQEIVVAIKNIGMKECGQEMRKREKNVDRK